jgi:WD40 repeat protein
MQEAFEYFMDSIASHLIAAEDWPRLWRLLRNFEFIALRIERGGFDALVDDFESGLASFEAKCDIPLPPKTSTEHLLNSVTIPQDKPAKLPLVSAGTVQWTPPAVPFGQPLPADKAIDGSIARYLRVVHDSTRERRESYERSEAAQVKDFAVFVRTHRTALVYDPHEILSLALNASRWSACSVKGEAEAKIRGRPFLRRRGRLPELYDTYAEIDPALAPREFVRFFAASESAELVAVGSPKSTAVWNVSARSPLLRIGATETKISCIAISGDGRVVALGHTNGTVTAWDVDRSVQLLSFPGFQEPIRTIALSFNGDSVFVGLLNRIVSYETRTARTSSEFVDSRLDSALCLTEAHGPGLLFSGHSKGYLAIWNVSDGKCLDILSGGAASKRVVSVDCSDDGRFLAAGYGDNSVRIWDREIRQCLRKLMIGRGSGLNSVSMSSDGSVVVGCDKKQLIRMFDVDAGTFLKILSAHGNDIAGARPSKSFQRLVSASVEGVIRVWSPEGVFRHSVPAGHEGPVKALALSRDGKRLVSGSTDKTVRIWQTVFPKCLTVLRGHTDSVWGVAWLNDNNCVSLGGDLRICLWSLKHESCTRIIECHEWTGLLRFERIYNPKLRSIAAFRDGKLVIFDLISGSETVVDHRFACQADFVGWVGDRLFFATGNAGDVFVVEGSVAKTVMQAGGVVRDVIAGPQENGILVAGTNGVSWSSEIAGHKTPISTRVASSGIHLIGNEACIVGHDRITHFVDLFTTAEREIRTESGKNVRRGSLKTSIDQFQYLPSEQLCLSVHGRFFRLWEPQSGTVRASYFAESDIMCMTRGLVGSTLACGTGIGQIHFLVLHRAQNAESGAVTRQLEVRDSN